MKTNDKGIIIPHFLVMMKWIENEGKCASQIVQETGISHPHVFALKKTFLKKGWIVQHTEKRRKNIFLTDAGRAVLLTAEPLMNAIGMSLNDIPKYLQKSKLKNDADDTIKLKPIKEYIDHHVQEGHLIPITSDIKNPDEILNDIEFDDEWIDLDEDDE